MFKTIAVKSPIYKVSKSCAHINIVHCVDNLTICLIFVQLLHMEAR